jgi:HNH endonuclease
MQKYIATEVFTCLPPELRILTYSTYINTPTLQDKYSLPLTSSTAASILTNLDPTITETLTTYALIAPSSTASEALAPVLTTYVSSITTPPPPPSQTKCLAQGCEICLRPHIPLTYHHLIPRMVHDKAVRRGWHTKDELNNVAWLCRACHSFVHRLAGHEELARELYTVKRLLEREEVSAWAAWAGSVRWKAR